MKAFFVTVVAAALGYCGSAQVQNLAQARTAPERKAILDALRGPVGREVGAHVSFAIEVLNVQGGWAFLRGRTLQANGQPVNWAKTPSYGAVATGDAFDGDGTAALLHKVGPAWRHVVHVIGPTDVAWACWWKEYHAPRAIFDLSEDCR